MSNQIPLSGLSDAAGGILLPDEQGGILTNGILQENGALQLAGDSRTTNKRKSTFNIWLGRPTAGPVGEGGRKPVTGAEFGSTEMLVKKFASIVLFTDEQIEDVQDGDMNVLVDSGVRQALAQSIDAHMIGKDAGANITSVFTNALRATTATGVEVDLSKPDGLQLAVSSAMGTLEDNGYGNPSDMGVLLGHGFQKLLRDAKEDDQTTAASQRRLYGGGDPLYGLSRSISTNLNTASEAAGVGKIVGFVIHKPNVHLRLRTDVRVKVSTEASIELPAAFTDGDGNSRTDVNLFQDNMTAVRYELRLGTFTHDLNRAVVPLINAA